MSVSRCLACGLRKASPEILCHSRRNGDRFVVDVWLHVDNSCSKYSIRLDVTRIFFSHIYYQNILIKIVSYQFPSPSSSSVCLSCQAIRRLLRPHRGVLSVRLVVGWGDNPRQYASSTVVVRTHRMSADYDYVRTNSFLVDLPSYDLA